MTIITERRLRRLFADRGFEVHGIRCNKHWVATVARTDGGPRFNVVVSRSPSDGWRFPHQFATALRRAEREARSRG
jgi:hypothetical protein